MFIYLSPPHDSTARGPSFRAWTQQGELLALEGHCIILEDRVKLSMKRVRKRNMVIEQGQLQAQERAGGLVTESGTLGQ
jgi:hypothetical protein